MNLSRHTHQVHVMAACVCGCRQVREVGVHLIEHLVLVPDTRDPQLLIPFPCFGGPAVRPSAN